jgi:hypothetical protein
MPYVHAGTYSVFDMGRVFVNKYITLPMYITEIVL